MRTSHMLEQLMEALRCLPGVGPPKSAQRMAFHLLQRDRKGGLQLADALSQAMTEIGHCTECRTFTEEEVCHICTNPKRQENGQICVVESPADIAAVEATGQYSGRYFVLMGHLSPLDGIGPSDIGLDVLDYRLRRGDIAEVILATNPTVEAKPLHITSQSYVKNTKLMPAASRMVCLSAENLSLSMARRCHTRC